MQSVAVASWLRGYHRAWLTKDLVGGLAAGAVVIPQAMAYARIADLPTEVGLYTCMVPMAVYALVGGSRALSVSTTSTIAVLTGSTLVAAGVAAGTDDPARALATLTLLVGIILFVARILRARTRARHPSRRAVDRRPPAARPADGRAALPVVRARTSRKGA